MVVIRVEKWLLFMVILMIELDVIVDVLRVVVIRVVVRVFVCFIDKFFIVMLYKYSGV